MLIRDIQPNTEKKKQEKKDLRVTQFIMITGILILLIMFGLFFFGTAQAQTMREMNVDDIVSKINIDKTLFDGIYIEVPQIDDFGSSVRVYARAWDSQNNQIGFGDGTVDLEQFIIKNPPVLIPDNNNGTILKDIYDITGKEVIQQKRFTYNPQYALLKVLAQVIKNKKQTHTNSDIIPYSLGNTTYVIYPDVDYVHYSGIDSSWAAVHDQLTADQIQDNTTNYYLAENSSGSNWHITRVSQWFDTSDVDSEDIDSSSYTMFANAFSSCSGTFYIEVVDYTGSKIATVNDYQKFGASSYGSLEVPSGTLDEDELSVELSSDLNAMFATGSTSLGFILDDDLNDSAPGCTGGQQLLAYGVDYSGTTFDPYLTVEMSAAAATSTLIGYATSTIEQTQQNIFNGIVIFFMSAALMAFLLNVNKFKQTE